MDSGNDYSLSFDFIASDLSKGSNSNSLPSPTGYEVRSKLELLSLNRLSESLEKLLLDVEYDHSDAVIEVEGTPVGVNRSILAARSPFFHDLFKIRYLFGYSVYTLYFFPEIRITKMDDWEVSAEKLDSLERDALKQLAERNSSSAAATTSYSNTSNSSVSCFRLGIVPSSRAINSSGIRCL